MFLAGDDLHEMFNFLFVPFQPVVFLLQFLAVLEEHDLGKVIHDGCLSARAHFTILLRHAAIAVGNVEERTDRSIAKLEGDNDVVAVLYCNVARCQRLRIHVDWPCTGQVSHAVNKMTTLADESSSLSRPLIPRGRRERTGVHAIENDKRLLAFHKELLDVLKRSREPPVEPDHEMERFHL